MAERYLDEISPSPEQLRAWGYDDDLYLTSQDEDLLLHDLAYLPILLELASDPDCPKQYYAAWIAYTYAQLCVLRKRRAEVEAIRAIVEVAPPEVDPHPPPHAYRAHLGWVQRVSRLDCLVSGVSVHRRA